MTKFTSTVLFLLAGAAALLAASAVQAQYYYSQPYAQQPLYPYVVAPQPYAQVQSYPYAIQREQPPRSHVRRRNHVRDGQASAGRTDPALVQELRARASKTGNRRKIDNTVIVRGKPVVIERKRYVDDPPKIVQRHYVVDDPAPAAQPPSRGRGLLSRGAGNASAGGNQIGRVIRAEAEVTILGPDRMSIRLFRRERGLDTNAKAKTEETRPKNDRRMTEE